MIFNLGIPLRPAGHFTARAASLGFSDTDALELLMLTATEEKKTEAMVRMHMAANRLRSWEPKGSA